MMDWADQSYFSIKKPFRAHNVYDFPSWLRSFKGDHPEQVVDLQNDILNGHIKIKTRKNEDIENMVNSLRYKVARRFLIIIEKPDRLKQKVRKIISQIVHYFTRKFEKFIKQYNV
jgi:hypothetical protein